MIDHLQTFKELYVKYGIRLIINPEAVSLEKTISLDVEHDESGEFVGLGIYCGGSNTVYYYSNLVAAVVCDLRSIKIIAHNGKTDFELLNQWGIPVANEQLIWDTQLIEHIIDSSRKAYGLKALAKDIGIEYPSYDDLVGKKTEKQSKERKTLDKHPIELVAMYCGMDCYATHKLYERQCASQFPAGTHPVRSEPPDYFTQIERPVSFILQNMENRGICVDLQYLLELKGKLEVQKTPLEAKIKNELGNINLGSPKQLLEALNAKGIYPTLKNRPSTDKRALANLSDPIVSDLLAYSELDTLLSSFVTPYLERNQEVVHPYFNQCGTRTGRLSCSNPNLLQIPRRTENGKLVRRMFVPRFGMLMGDCDFGQIEPRVLAHLSKDPVLCDMFNDGVDFHTFTSERLSISRERAKVLNLSVGYRATFKSVMSQLRCDQYEAQKQIEAWWNLFPALRRWQDKLIWESRRGGFCTTLLGRRIQIDGLDDGNPWKRQSKERQLINNITQGSAAEIMKMAMIKISQMDCFDSSFGLLVQVYDELLFESRKVEVDIHNVSWAMEKAVALDIPLTVDGKTGSNWSEAH